MGRGVAWGGQASVALGWPVVASRAGCGAARIAKRRHRVKPRRGPGSRHDAWWALGACAAVRRQVDCADEDREEARREGHECRHHGAVCRERQCQRDEDYQRAGSLDSSERNHGNGTDLPRRGARRRRDAARRRRDARTARRGSRHEYGRVARARNVGRLAQARLAPDGRHAWTRARTAGRYAPKRRLGSDNGHKNGYVKRTGPETYDQVTT